MNEIVKTSKGNPNYNNKPSKTLHLTKQSISRSTHNANKTAYNYLNSQKKISRDSLKDVNQTSNPHRKVTILDNNSVNLRGATSLNLKDVSKKINSLEKNDGNMNTINCTKISDYKSNNQGSVRPTTSISPNNTMYNKTRRPQIIINNYLIGEKNLKDSYISNSIVISDKNKKLSPDQSTKKAVNPNVNNNLNNSCIMDSNQLLKSKHITMDSIHDPKANCKVSSTRYIQANHKNPLRQFFDGVSNSGCQWQATNAEINTLNDGLRKKGHKKNALSMVGSDSEWIKKLNSMAPNVTYNHHSNTHNNNFNAHISSNSNLINNFINSE